MTDAQAEVLRKILESVEASMTYAACIADGAAPIEKARSTAGIAEMHAETARDGLRALLTLQPDPEAEPDALDVLDMLGAIAKDILGDHATVRTIDLDPLPAWTDPDGLEHLATPVLRVEVLIDDKSFGMEGPATSAPGMVAYIASQLKGSELASPIVVPPEGFKA